MPSRKLADHCPKCRSKNHLRARFCNDCGAKLDENRADRDRNGRMKLHADIAHPINSDCRSKFQAKVVEAYLAELEKSKQPGYKPVEFEDDEESAPLEHDDLIADLKREAEARHGRRSGPGERGEERREDMQPVERIASEPSAPVERPRSQPMVAAGEEHDGFGAGLL